ncbi:MAG: 50S ribosomal protein L32e [Candidatus Bathyarchaeia archaeon]
MSEEGGGAKQKAPSQPKKRKKPEFKRQESWRYKRIKENWRRPRGLDSKMRKKVKGWPPSPNKGYRSPKKTRNLHPSGLREVRVMNVKDLEKVDAESEVIRIGHTVGDKKRIEIINRAREMGIRILNPKEIEVET